MEPVARKMFLWVLTPCRESVWCEVLEKLRQNVTSFTLWNYNSIGFVSG